MIFFYVVIVIDIFPLGEAMLLEIAEHSQCGVLFSTKVSRENRGRRKRKYVHLSFTKPYIPKIHSVALPGATRLPRSVQEGAGR